MLKMAAEPLEKLVGISEGAKIELAVTDFLDGRPLKAERIGECVAVAFYNNCPDCVFGMLVHPIKGTNPALLFSMIKEEITPVGTSVALIGNKNSYLVGELLRLFGKAGYDVRLKGFDEAALRDATLYPNGTLDVYRHDTKASKSFSLGFSQ